MPSIDHLIFKVDPIHYVAWMNLRSPDPGNHEEWFCDFVVRSGNFYGKTTNTGWDLKKLRAHLRRWHRDLNGRIEINSTWGIAGITFVSNETGGVLISGNVGEQTVDMGVQSMTYSMEADQSYVSEWIATVGQFLRSHTVMGSLLTKQSSEPEFRYAPPGSLT